MQLLPVYYSTLNSKKRKPKKKSKSLLEAERKHEKWLAKMVNGKSGRVNDTSPKLYQRQSDAVTEGSSPSLSNKIPVGVAPKRIPTPHNFTVAPAYNKGSYQVISRKDVKDIGR